MAVIGAGPSGLSAANDLARLGYSVTIYESFPIPGGMLNVGIPPYRLPREVVKQAIEEVRRLGVEIITGTPIGKELNLESLRKKYDAVYIAAGAHKAEKLGIPGEDLQGVIHGVTFMRRVNLERGSEDWLKSGGGRRRKHGHGCSPFFSSIGSKGGLHSLSKDQRGDACGSRENWNRWRRKESKSITSPNPIQVLSRDGSKGLWCSMYSKSIG